MRHLFAGLMILAAAAAAGAQSFNVDMNRTSGNGAGIPASSFGAAAGQPGTWNDINTSSPSVVTLKNLDGSNSSVTLTRSLEGTFQSAFDVDTTGEFDKLIEDFQRSDSADMNFTFNNLETGKYAVYVYGATPGSTNQSSLTILNAIGDDFQTVGGNMTSNSLVPGLTHSIHMVNVSAGNSLTVKVIGFGSNGSGTIGGMQLRKMNSSIERIRFLVNDNSPLVAVDGLTWDSALKDLQIPVKYADILGGSEVEIWVASGFYRPTAGTNRSEAFVIPSNLRMYGGFDATEDALSERGNPTFVPTYLNGSIGAAGNTDNSYNVVIASNTSASTILDGFYIVNGRASGSGNQARGGGMYISNGSLTVRRCTFSSNYSSIDGGAVYTNGGTPDFVECTFYNNESDGAGGALMASTAGSPWIENCRFIGNNAAAGGALKFLFTQAGVTGCVFTGNTTSFDDGGAIHVGGDDGDDLTVTNCTFSKNNAAQSAGGIYISGGADLNLRNSILWGNTDGVSQDLEDKQLIVSSFNGSFLTEVRTTIEGTSDPNPLFVDADGPNNVAGDFDDDVRLQLTSPAIDAGDNGQLPLDFTDLDEDGAFLELQPLDIDRNPRRYDVPAVANTGSGIPPVDRGAYEVSFDKGDMNCDGVVNFADIDPFVAALGGQSAYQSQYPNCVWTNADVTCDGVVDFSDIDTFVQCLSSGICGCGN